MSDSHKPIRRYSTNEKELLAIVRGIRKFSAFLLPKQFVIRTDNTQVSGLIFNKLPSEPQYRRLHRWQVLLSFYSFSIEYIKGRENPLEKWNQNHERATLTLKDPSIIIRVKPMLYNEDDKIEY